MIKVLEMRRLQSFKEIFVYVELFKQNLYLSYKYQEEGFHSTPINTFQQF